MSDYNYVIVLTTMPADGHEDQAEWLARTLVAERLAACVNVQTPMQSIYRWEGIVEHAAERQLVIKTATGCLERLQTRLTELHPYEVPECVVVPILGGSEGYLAWLGDSVR